MAILKLKTTGKAIAGGIVDDAHAAQLAKEAEVDFALCEIEYSPKEISELRRKHYSANTDFLFFDYMAAVTEYGEESEKATAAKQAWMSKRAAIKSTLPTL